MTETQQILQKYIPLDTRKICTLAMFKRSHLQIFRAAPRSYFCIHKTDTKTDNRSALISNGSLHQFVTNFLGEKNMPENMNEETCTKQTLVETPKKTPHPPGDGLLNDSAFLHSLFIRLFL